jgi:thiol-disulfide isomerase/thioredoxin
MFVNMATPKLLGAGLMCSLLLGLAGPACAAKLLVGDDTPDVLGRSATGEKIHMGGFRGKVVVISFSASWCGPCRREMSVMLRLQKAATRNKLVVLSVNWREDPERFREIRSILKDGDLALISDGHGDMGKAYDVDSIPHMVVVDRHGKIAAIHIGYAESEIPTFVAEINDLLQQESARIEPASEDIALATPPILFASVP